MVDRIKQVMEYYEETPAGFAEKLGINRSNLTHLFSGRNQPSLEFAKKVLKAYPEVSTEWLIMGVGLMIKDPAEIAAEPPRKTLIQTNLFDMMDDEPQAEPVQETIANEESAPVEQTATVDAVEPVKPEVAAPQEEPQMATESVKVDEPKIVTPEPQVKIAAQPVETKVVTPQNQPVVPAPESNIQNDAVHQSTISDSQTVENNAPAMAMAMAAATLPQNSKPTAKKIEKIIFFFDDDTFKVYNA